jgi:gluconolactonase
MRKRSLLAGVGAGIAATAARGDTLPFVPAPYPDPAVEVLDPSFAPVRNGLAGLERLHTGSRFTEGPVYFGGGRYLVWTDIPNSRILRWDEQTGQVGEFIKPANNANGMTRDRQGRLLICEQLTRRVVRIEHDGAETVIADRHDGKRLNSPNDVAVTSDDSIWFTDPPFGILGYYQGAVAQPELPTNVYRVDGRTGEITVAVGDVNRPNGLAFSPAERVLYVGEGGSASIRAYDLGPDGRVAGPRRSFYDGQAGDAPDGMRCDTAGNLWVAWGTGDRRNGVRIFNPQGRTIGFIHLPERCGNLTFGGRYRNRLFMTASRSLYSIYVNAQGATA